MTNVGFIRPCRYATWISCIVPAKKKNDKLHVYIDFRDLNKATPKDEYLMLIADMVINTMASHNMISFYGNARYNQNFMTEEEMY
jgi:hypothetical protein